MSIHFSCRHIFSATPATLIILTDHRNSVLLNVSTASRIQVLVVIELGARRI